MTTATPPSDRPTPRDPVRKTGRRSRRRVHLRPASAQDQAFAERLYVETMQPLLSRLDAWDKLDALDRFRRQYAIALVWIVHVEGRDIGFLQVSESEGEISLDQIHLEAAYRSRGIGSVLICDLQRRAGREHKTLSLSVVRNNPALALYRRLAFEVVGEDDVKLHMQWRAAPRPRGNPEPPVS